MRTIAKGENVYWNDPAGESSGMYQVLKSCDLSCSEEVLIGNGASETTVMVDELEFEIQVVFRKFRKDGDIIALFPYEQFSSGMVGSYMHIGQHSGADYKAVIGCTIPATSDEYQPLLHELTHLVGYKNLKIIKRK